MYCLFTEYVTVTGTYSAAGSNVCAACEAGYACPTPDVSPVLCGIGLYR